MTGLTKIAEGGVNVRSPCVVRTGGVDELYVVSEGTGEVLKVAVGGESALVAVADGFDSPQALAWDGGLVVAECAAGRAGLWKVADDGSRQRMPGSSADDRQCKGYSAVAVGKGAAPKLFVSESGPAGETHLGNPTGSVLSYDPATATCTPVVAGVLAQPAGLCTSPDGSALYVCETCTNRVLRCVQRPAGVWHASVFFQFSGLLGPVAVDCDSNGNIYVGRFDFREQAAASLVTILRPNGEEFASFAVPGAELSGLCYSKGHNAVFITEASTNTVYQCSLTEQVS